jgi:mono/diheme cytochrome c family protein
MWKKWPMSLKICAVVFSLFIAIQLVPYGRNHQNPPVTSEPVWDSPRTRELFFKACADCHSNETIWPWYAKIAPASWLVTHDVEEGREYFNISVWDQQRKQEADEAAETIVKGEMPLWFYVPLHPEADLSESEKQELIAGMRRMFNQNDDESHEGHGDDH